MFRFEVYKISLGKALRRKKLMSENRDMTLSWRGGRE
jgi:hypothetical protein